MQISAKLQLFSLWLLLGNPYSSASFPFNYTDCESMFLSGQYGREGAVDQNGNKVLFLNETRGLRYAQCLEICGSGFETEDLTSVSGQLTGWLLPWLALTAQLPFQTRDQWQDIFTVFLVIGSPILAMYSLLLSLFNAKWAKEKCARVARGTLQKEGVSDRMNDVGLVLAACQHVPLEVQHEAMLHCSIRVKENEKWWADLSKTLRDTARRFPASLWAQMGLAAITFTFTIINAFTTSGGWFLGEIHLPSRLHNSHFGDWNNVDLDSANYFRLVFSTYTVHSSKYPGGTPALITRPHRFKKIL